MFQQFFRSVILGSLFLNMVPAAALAARFTDVSANTQYSAAIEALAAKGIVSGQADGSAYAPSSPINRAEFLKIVMGSLGSATPATSSNCFPDVQKQWFAPYVCTAEADGIVSGYPDGTFRPDRNVTFVEAAKIISTAYGQHPQVSYGEWYDGYANALEESKAIPVSISGLDKPLTRGEMAEMLWRVMEKKTDQPSKAVVNLKNPDLKVNLAGDAPVKATSCADLTILSQQQGQRTDVMLYRDSFGVGNGPILEEKAIAPSAAPTAAGSAGTDYSQTNVQVEGVDEADIVKTDGAYLYIVRNNDKSTVTIVQAKPQDQMKVVATIDLTNLGVTASDLYVDSGRLTVIGTAFMDQPVIMDKRAANSMIWPGYYGSSKTAVVLYDVRMPAAPKQLRVLKFDGNAVTTRRIGNTLYVVLTSGVRYWGGPVPLEKSESPVPQLEDSKTGTTKAMVPCGDVMILPRIPSPSYVAVSAVRLDDASKDVQSEVILGSADNVYASEKNLYVAATRYSYDWNPAGSSNSEQTQIYRFGISADGLSMSGQGTVPGHILNQFAMDESGDYFRVATTVSPTWSPEGREMHSVNGLYVLDRTMEQVGKVDGIAPGESIYAARFMGKRAYLVTFKQVDPFFVIDLSNPRAPKILGQLKIPGYSNYLHPYDDTHVIGIGQDVDESIDTDKVHSEDAVYYTAIQGVKMSLFDVSDVSNPVEMHKVIIGDRGTQTAVTQDHKALLFEKDRNLLALPILVTKRPSGAAKSADGNPVFQGAYVYNVTLSKGFEQLGSITHYTDPDVFLKAGSYWYGQEQDISRIVRIDNSLYTISQASVQSNALTTLKQEGKVTLGK